MDIYTATLVQRGIQHKAVILVCKRNPGMQSDNNLFSLGPSSHTKTPSLQMTPIALPFPAMAVGLVHWSQRCVSALVHATPSLHPPTITLERMEPVFCSAVHLVRCRFMPVSMKAPRYGKKRGWMYFSSTGTKHSVFRMV